MDINECIGTDKFNWITGRTHHVVAVLEDPTPHARNAHTVVTHVEGETVTYTSSRFHDAFVREND